MRFYMRILFASLVAMAAVAIAAPSFAQDASQSAAPALPPPPAAPSGMTEAVIAHVNDDVITNYDVGQRMRLLVITAGIQPTRDDLAELQQYALSALVDERLEMQELRREEKENPRTEIGNPGVFRLTELCRGVGSSATPKPLSRVGDNGSVGGQSCCGIGHLLEVLQACEQEKVPVAVWPMDGLDIQSPAYAGKHVFAEPYPSAKRDREVKQTDVDDARESVRFLRERDQRAELPAVCDLSTLTPQEARRVQFEGWILAHVPWNRVI